MVPKFALTLSIICVIFFVLISVHCDKIPRNGIVYDFKRNSQNLLGKGSCAEVYKGKRTNGTQVVDVAMKFETTEIHRLGEEYDIYKALEDKKCGIPKCYEMFHYGQYPFVLVTELMGETLKTILNQMEDNKFSLETTMKLGVDLLNKFECFHKNEIVYRDLKPDNILVGLSDRSQIYITDFGVSTFYREGPTHDRRHIAEQIRKDTKIQAGNLETASYYSFDYEALSRRDDIESLAYLLIKFLKGQLPWSHMDVNRPTQFIYMKNRDYIETLVGETRPDIFVPFLTYAHDLNFKGEPNYEHLRRLLRRGFGSREESDIQYDWIGPKDKKSQKEKVPQKPQKTKSKSNRPSVWTCGFC